MSAPIVATRLLAARNVRKLLGCGCLAVVCVIVLPLFMVFSLMSGLISSVSGGAAGGSQADEFTVGVPPSSSAAASHCSREPLP